MLRMLAFASCVAMFSTVSFAAEPATTTELGKDIRVAANVGLATNVSSDGQAATVLFDNVLVELEPAVKTAAGTQNQTSTRTKVVTLEVPYTTDARSLTMTLDIRGSIDADAASTARLIACAGDATKVLSLSPAGTEKVQLKGKAKATAAAAYPQAKLGDFQDRVEFTVQTRAAKPVLQITLLLLVEHDTDNEGDALLVVDSLDLEITKGKAKLR
jgi:hypothetical protein